MAGFRYLIFSFICFLIGACAQVGSISGGVRDVSAPKPIEDQVTPKNETVNFSGKKVEIPFDEFFKLNDPIQNIVIVPPHASINAAIKRKTLRLNWEEDLQPNTTYAIFLNNAVRDVSEGNDSIFQYVFSTGNYLDSLTYSVSVVDAWTGKAASKCLVGLFDETTNDLRSFGETNSDGIVALNYLPPGNYRVSAFYDENGDLKLQSHEEVGFPLNPIVTIDRYTYDSIPIRVYLPEPTPKIRTGQFSGPGSFLIGATRDISDGTLFLNNSAVDSSQYKFISPDSLQLFADVSEINLAEIIVRSSNINDTVSIRFTDARKNTAIELRCSNAYNQVAPSENAMFELNDLILSVDTSLIEVKNLKDSTIIHNYTIAFFRNELTFSLDKEDVENISFSFNEDAVRCLSGSSLPSLSNVTFKAERSYGSFLLNLEYYSSPILLYLEKGGNTFRIEHVAVPIKDYILSEIPPGNYTFRVVRDANNNKAWDVGSVALGIQPEVVDTYSKQTKIRANWEVALSLIPIK